jgi:uncharacterized protein (DUF305 family)
MKDHTTSGMIHYQHLAVMLVMSFVAMYLLMYAMTDRFDDVFMSLNQVYMAGLMTAPMAVIELVVMRAMYENARLNLIIIAVAVLVGIAFFAGIRTQAAISDAQFLRSMIPHHSSAILMCERASISSPEIRELCRAITVSQRDEINQMNGLLEQRP